MSRIMDEMNDSKSYGYGFRCYKNIQTVVNKNDYSS